MSSVSAEECQVKLRHCGVFDKRRWILEDFKNLREEMTSIKDSNPETDDMCLVSSHLDEDFLMTFASPKLIRLSELHKARARTCTFLCRPLHSAP